MIINIEKKGKLNLNIADKVSKTAKVTDITAESNNLPLNRIQLFHNNNFSVN